MPEDVTTETAGLCTHFWIEAVTDRSPDATAVVFEDQRVSYAGLDERANRLARHLLGLGVQKEQAVAVCLSRSIELVVALLAIWKAGGCYVPLDPEYPLERLAYMLEDSGAPVLITERSAAPNVPFHPQVLYLDEEAGRIDSLSSERPEVDVGPGDLAYVIYTSGSTGDPKGVMIEHGALVNFLRSMQRRPGLEEGDRLLAVTTICFDIAALELFLPLVTGACVTIAREEVARDAARVMALIERSGATVMQATPATWRMLLDHGWEGGPSLRVLCGGEALSRDLAERLLPRCAVLWNLYGPTEATVWASVEEVQSGTGPVPLGEPVDNTQLHILDDSSNPVQDGEEGELCIGGLGLARGYLGRGDLTADRFVPDPAGSGARIYRTGDVCRRREDGAIEFFGRVDHQVKLRGFRIELGEIEAALEKHPAVRQAVVLAIGLETDKRLVGYLLAEAEEPANDRLREHLSQRLPHYMLPATYVFLDEFPLTLNGKVDRKALPDPSGIRPDTSKAFVEPETDTQKWIAEIWAEVLGVDRVGLQDDFFELGGHSLKAVQVAARLRETFGVDVAITSLFESPTVASLSEAIDVIEFQPTHRKSMLELYRRHFGAWSTARFEERWNWQYGTGNPYISERLPFGVVALHEGELVGHMAGFPLPWRIDGERHMVLCGADLAVDDRYRIFTMQVVGKFAQKKPCFSNGVHPSLRKLFEHFGGKTVPASRERFVLRRRHRAKLTQAVRRRLPAGVAGQATPGVVGRALDSLPVRALLRLAGKGLPACRTLPRSEDGAEIHRLQRFDGSYDELWSVTRRKYRSTLDKDATYMNWRYVDCPTMRSPILLGLYEHERLAAVAVAGAYVLLDDQEQPCGHKGEILDLIAEGASRAGLRELLVRTCRELDGRNVDSIGAMSGEVETHEILEELGFVREPDDRFDCLVLMDPATQAKAGVETGDRWYLTGGDGDGLYAFLT